MKKRCRKTTGYSGEWGGKTVVAVGLAFEEYSRVWSKRKKGR